MNAALLLEHYARIADAPDAIARLRRFVLDLAVRGKLVEQDADDEPASELLKRIATERARMVKSGEAQKSKDLPSTVDDADFDLPETWLWTRLGSITSYIQRGKSPKYAEADGVPVISQKCVQWAGLNLAAARLITSQSLSAYEEIRFIRDGDLLWNSTGTGTIGRIVKVEQPPESLVCDSHVTIVRCLKVDPEYVRTWLRSDHVYGAIEGRAAGSTNQVELTAQMAINQVVPLPPLAEQHRIVAKVNELMALCDQLETTQARREAARDTFTLSTLAKLNSPDPETFVDDVRFALANLASLTARAYQIKQLRQTIVNLAARGKLVAQEANDEPASALLKRITAQKSDMVKTGSIPRPKEGVRDPDFLTDPLPASWLPIALGDVCNLVTSGSRGWGEFYAESGPGFVRAQNIRFGKLRLEGLACVNPPAKSEGARTQVAKGDLLVVITGAGVTNPALLNVDLGEAYVSQHVGLVRPTDTKLSEWLLLCLMADAGGRAELTLRAYGAGKPGLNLDNIRSLSVPLPPLAEQHRIVTKVNELMELCNQLEASLDNTEQFRSKMLEAVLHQSLLTDIERAGSSMERVGEAYLEAL